MLGPVVVSSRDVVLVSEEGGDAGVAAAEGGASESWLGMEVLGMSSDEDGVGVTFGGFELGACGVSPMTFPMTWSRGPVAGGSYLYPWNAGGER